MDYVKINEQIFKNEQSSFYYSEGLKNIENILSLFTIIENHNIKDEEIYVIKTADMYENDGGSYKFLSVTDLKRNINELIGNDIVSINLIGTINNSEFYVFIRPQTGYLELRHSIENNLSSSLESTMKHM